MAQPLVKIKTEDQKLFINTDAIDAKYQNQAKNSAVAREDIIVDVQEKPNFIATVTQDFQHIRVTGLKQVLEADLSVPGQKFKCQFYVVNLLPWDIKEVCRLFCKLCLQSFSYQEVKVDVTSPDPSTRYLCPHCQRDRNDRALEQIFMLQMDCKDSSLDEYDHSDVIPILWYSFNEKY